MRLRTLHPVLRGCLRLLAIAGGLVIAASALVVSLLLLAFVSLRALAVSVLGRGKRPAPRVRPARAGEGRGFRIPARDEVVDVEARSLP